MDHESDSDCNDHWSGGSGPGHRSEGGESWIWRLWLLRLACHSGGCRPVPGHAPGRQCPAGHLPARLRTLVGLAGPRPSRGLLHVGPWPALAIPEQRLLLRQVLAGSALAGTLLNELQFDFAAGEIGKDGFGSMKEPLL